MKWRAEGHILVEDETCETIADFFADDPKSHERCKLAATAPEKARIVIYIYGGLIQWIFTDKPVEIAVLDGDTDDCDENELEELTFEGGEKAKVYSYLGDTTHEPEKVKGFFDELLPQLEKK